MKMIFIVFNIKENGKFYALADTIRTGENLIVHCNRYNSNISLLCESRKQAETIAVEWNKSYKENGTSLF